jgi:hypothetical protein
VTYDNNPLNLPDHARTSDGYTVDSISDEQGLKNAYATDSGLYSWHDKLFIAGTKSIGDIRDDALYIPAWGNSQNIQRYKDATEYLKNHPEVDTAIGHSLGSTVSLQLQKDSNQIQHTRTYSSPTLDFGSMLEKLTGKDVHGNKVEAPDRYANYLDPIALFDGRAQRSWNLDNIFNPHSHFNISSKFKNSVVIDPYGNEFEKDRIINWEDQEGPTDSISNSNADNRVVR